MKHDSYIIAGPTASGKSDFAHQLAQRLGGVIINCDSVQIYRDIETISASPFAGRNITDDIDGVPYRLFSVLPLATQISVADYQTMARREYDAARAGGRPAIFVGGTGYYIGALLNGISPMPDIGPAARRRARDMVAHDITAARKILPPEFKATDPQRVARGLEVFFQTGRHITEFQALPARGAIMPRPKTILINPPADVLRTRIATRIEKMMSGDAIAETQRIIANKWNENRAIGAAELCAYLRGEISRDECITSWRTKTNQYAKRQRTWFRTQFAADITVTDATQIDAII